MKHLYWNIIFRPPLPNVLAARSKQQRMQVSSVKVLCFLTSTKRLLTSELYNTLSVLHLHLTIKNENLELAINTQSIHHKWPGNESALFSHSGFNYFLSDAFSERFSLSFELLLCPTVLYDRQALARGHRM